MWIYLHILTFGHFSLPLLREWDEQGQVFIQLFISSVVFYWYVTRYQVWCCVLKVSGRADRTPAMPSRVFVTMVSWERIQCEVLRCYLNKSRPLIIPGTPPLIIFLLYKNSCTWDFPGGPVVKTPYSQCRGPGFDPWSGNELGPTCLN